MNQVFSINFIREEQIPIHVRRIGIYAALAYLFLNALWLAGSLGYLCYSAGSSALAGKQAGIQGQMESLYEQATQNLNQINSLALLGREKFLVADKLRALARTLPTRTWIASVSSDRGERRLMIQALYLIDSGKPYELPTKAWMKALRSDPLFNPGLKSLELVNSFQKTQGSAELFSLTFLAEWEGVPKK